MKTIATTPEPGKLPRREPRQRPAREPFVPGPRKVITSARALAGLLEEEPALWPGLTALVTDTNGRPILHYAAGRGSSQASALFGPDGVLARWRSLLREPEEVGGERLKGRERVVTLRGRHRGHPVTVLFTVVGAS